MNLKKLVTPIALVVAVLLSAVGASAASVGTLGGSIFSAGGPVTFPAANRTVSSITRTTTGSPATMTSVSATVTGTNLSELNGQAVNLILLNSSNAQVQAITATLATGTNLTVGSTTATISLAVPGSPLASTVTGWAMFIAGVQLLDPATPSSTRVVVSTTGSFTTVVTPWQDLLVTAGNTHTSLTAVTLTTATPVSQCLTLTVTSAGPGNSPQRWALDFDYSAGPFWGTPPSQIQKAVIQSTTGTVYHLVGTGTGSGPYDDYSNNATIRASQSLDIYVCQYNAPTAPNRTEAYTATPSTVSGTWNSGQACKQVTVTGNGRYPFYFGWQVTIDMSDAYAYLRTFDAAAPRAFVYTPDSVSPAFSGAVTSYTVNNYRDDAIKDTDSYDVVLCASRY